ncbi:putative alpha-glucosidase [Rosa chinensis]|uniref:Putative alpha-glucosidase n=2 Tax=Rosa chinensis TaxID=74649 RepID=A0A2P6Q6U0_ROSCH|nr:putative alpha-glucosidase [Rosa chinensis]
MGGEGGKWSFVRFRSALAQNGSLVLSSKVENGEFALSQGWIIDKITVLGLDKVNATDGYTLRITKGAKLKENTNVKANFHSYERFVKVESSVSLPIGKEFELEMKPNQILEKTL